MSKSQGFPCIPFFVNDAGANPRIILNPLWDPFTTVYIIPIPFKLPPNYQGSGPFFMDQKPGTLLTSSHREWIVTKLRISVLTRSHGSYFWCYPPYSLPKISIWYPLHILGVQFPFPHFPQLFGLIARPMDPAAGPTSVAHPWRSQHHGTRTEGFKIITIPYKYKL